MVNTGSVKSNLRGNNVASTKESIGLLPEYLQDMDIVGKPQAIPKGTRVFDPYRGPAGPSPAGKSSHQRMGKGLGHRWRA